MSERHINQPFLHDTISYFLPLQISNIFAPRPHPMTFVIIATITSIGVDKTIVGVIFGSVTESPIFAKKTGYAKQTL